MKEQLPLPPKSPRKRILGDEEEVPLRQNIDEIDEEDDDNEWQLRQGSDDDDDDEDDELGPGSIG